MAKEIKTYIMGECNTDGDTIYFDQIIGTEDDVKRCIAQAVRNAKSNDPDYFDYGSTAMKDIEVEPANGTLSGYAVFGNYSITFTATPMDKIQKRDFTKKSKTA